MKTFETKVDTRAEEGFLEQVRFCTVFFCCKTAILHSIGALPWVKSPRSLLHSIYDLSS